MRIRTKAGAGAAAGLLVLVAAAGAQGPEGPEGPLAPEEIEAHGVPGGPETLSLHEVYELARARNPMLRAARAAAEASESREASAGLPPDQMVEVGMMNVSLPGLEADMPGSMTPSVQAMQALPFPGKLGLSGRIAEQSTAMAEAGAEERWWEVRASAAGAFFAIYEIDEHLAVMEETIALLEDFHRIAQAMYASGSGRQSDVLRASVEVARMDAELQRQRTMRKVAAARLNAVLNRPAATPIPRVAFPDAPLAAPDAATLRAWAEESRPLLRRSRTGVDRARTRSTLARREIWPDFTIGVQYGQAPGREAGGTTRMGSAKVGFSVPVFARSRQLRARDEAAALEAAAEAELTGARAAVDARIGELLAELEQARTLLDLYRSEVLPQAAANVESSLAAYRVGAVDFMTLIDAQLTANQYEQELHTLMADHGRAVAELETTVGRELFPIPGMTAEAR